MGNDKKMTHNQTLIIYSYPRYFQTYGLSSGVEGAYMLKTYICCSYSNSSSLNRQFVNYVLKNILLPECIGICYAHNKTPDV